MMKSIGLALCFGLVSFAYAEEGPQASLQAGEANEVEVSTRQIASRIPALMEETRTRIQELEQNFERSGDEAIQLQILQLKQDAELQRLALLAEEARLAGRLEEAELAEAERERLQAPATPLERQPVLSPAEKLAQDAPTRVVTPRPATSPVPATTQEGGAK